MDPNQIEVITSVKNNKNILLLGQAGTGKSKVITSLLKMKIPDKIVYLTSTTGVSALNIGGITIHSFLGIGLGNDTKEDLYIKVYKNYKIRKILLNSNTLIVIDEISMLTLELFEKINYIFQKIRNNKSCFGGIQILLSGDFLQLQPINGKQVYKSNLIEDFKVIYLTKNYRQISDEKFQNILTNLRVDKLVKENITTLISLTTNEIDNSDSIMLFSTNKDVNNYNNKYINSNPNKEYKFIAEYKGKDKYYINDIKKQFKIKNIDELILKKDLKVMLTRNIDVSIGLVNGSLGIIKDIINGVPIVKFNNTCIIINKVTWEIVINHKIVASATQIPLIPAYASTIHKCQGLTINSAVIDLKNIFAPHMIYVALSRVKSIEGLKILNFDTKNIIVDKEVIKFYDKIKN